MSNKGFTLIEMLVIVSVVTLCMLAFPVYFHYQKAEFRFTMHTMKQRLLLAQATAIQEKRTVFVQVLPSTYILDDMSYDLHNATTCSIVQFQITATGAITPAGRIVCANSNTTSSIVIQLGSGQSDVR